MKIFSSIRSFVSSIIHRSRFEDDMDEELRAHIHDRATDLERSGLSRAEAQRRAHLDFGGYQKFKEECRESVGAHFIETLAQDVRYALRMLRKSPGFTVVAILTLALGIGATTAMFSVINGVLLRPLPYAQPERLIDVNYTFTSPGGSVEDTNVTPADYLILRQYNQTFQDVGIYDYGLNASGDLVNITHSGRPERVPVLLVSDGVLQALGVHPLLGRLFMSRDDEPGTLETAIVTYGYWRSKFDGDRSIVGKTIEVDDQPRIIIGVLPKQFVFLDKPALALLLPITIEHKGITLFYDDYGGIARLKPGVTLAQANADVSRMIPIKFRTFPPLGPTVANVEQRFRPNFSPLKKKMVGEVDEVLWVLMGGTGLVLLIACANVANLLLVRLEGRRQELAIRAALGASRGRISAELLVDGLILAMLGGVLGVGLAYVAVRVLVAAGPPGLPRLSEVGLDGRVVLFALLASLTTALVFGSIPAFKYAQASLGIRLQAGGRSSENRERRRTRSLLVIGQVALAVVLLVSAGLMIRTFRALTDVNPGFAGPSGVQTFRVYIPDAQVRDPERVAHIEQEISDKIQAIPGISAVGISETLPMDGSGWGQGCGAKGRTYSPTEPPPRCRLGFFGPGFLKTLGIPLLAGRDFTWSDAYNELPVAIVSENVAREFWHDPARALGEQITNGGPNHWRKVVGVVGDVRQDGVDKQAPPTLYLPILVDQMDGLASEGIQRDVAFVIRSPRAGSESLRNAVGEAVSSVDAHLPTSAVHTLDYYYTKSMARTSFALVMLGLAGGMGLLLGIVGLYGTVTYSVAQRTHELGIRIALGAQVGDIIRMVLREGLVLALIGIAIGLAAALGVTRLLSSLLYGTSATDSVTFVGVSILLTLVALAACFIPARRAIRVDPMVALRHE